MVRDTAQRVLAVTSPGLWTIRNDLATLLDAKIRRWPLHAEVDGFVGWGNRASGQRARKLAARHGVPAFIVEDGFLKSYAPGPQAPAHSMVVDEGGIYFDMKDDSRLSRLIDLPLVDPAEIARAEAIAARLCALKLSKYNNAPLLTLAEAGMSGRPFVLFVDQVAGDASIAGALADEGAFRRMLEDAVSRYPDHDLVVRTHPAAGPRSLIGQAATALGLAVTVPSRMNPWPLIEAADAVYTVSSQLGFEALMAGRTVHCFGASYYSHRGLTIDHLALGRSRPPASLATIIHRAYVDYPTYFDLHDRSVVTPEVAIEQMAAVRDHHNRLSGPVFTGGLSPWKRKAITPFITGMAGKPTHCTTLAKAVDRAHATDGIVALWGSSKPLPQGVRAVRLEDGFIRSRGLGALLALPCSLAIDDEHPYYDARGASRLETILKNTDFSPELIARAERLMARIVESGVSKYNVGERPALPAVAPGQMTILVPGQVEKDASIRYGSPDIRSNKALVAAVRARFPEAFIAYKEHPDVTSGMRTGGETPTDADIIVRSGNIKDWIDWADRIETMTSLTGFEALLRGKAVGVHGIPFYAGWGLTEDRLAVPRRGRPLSLAALAAGALILYPSYIHPLSGRPCRPEDLVEAIAAGISARPGVLARLIGPFARAINRRAVRFRDRRA